MEVVNKVTPSQEQIEGFMAPGHWADLHVEPAEVQRKAEHSDGRDTDLTGADAYAIYSAEVVEHLANVMAIDVSPLLPLTTPCW